jgi:hypothetical protein
VFLAGLPRTGTSWACRALHAALGGEICFEPCNWRAHPEMEPWHLRYLPADRPDQGFGALVDGVAEHRYTVVKEVHTYLAIEQWARQADRVVVIERPPLATAASWQRLGYDVRFRVDRLLDQPDLLADHLAPFEAHLREQAGWHGDLGRYWGASYFVLRRLAAAHPDWAWVHHDRLASDPAAGFRALLDGAEGADGAPPDLAALDAYVAEHAGPAPEGATPYDTYRTAPASLGPDEAAAVMAGAEPFGLLP